LPLRLVVDVVDLEVTLRLQRRLDAFHVRAVRVAVDLVCDLVVRDRAVRRPAYEDPALRGLEIVRRGLEHVSSHPEHLLAHSEARQVRGRAADDDAPGAVVSETPRGRLRVALHDANPGDLAAKPVGDDLREAGLVPAPRTR